MATRNPPCKSSCRAVGALPRSTGSQEKAARTTKRRLESKCGLTASAWPSRKAAPRKKRSNARPVQLLNEWNRSKRSTNHMEEIATQHPAIREAVIPEPPKKPEPRGDQTTLSEYLESLLVTVILALFGTTFIVQAFKIPSASMETTLLVGDHLLVNKFIFGGRGAWYEKFLPYRHLERGDIIVFKYPFQDHQHFVKRVIGLPGDRLKLVDQRVYINGTALHEPYVRHDS